jgi:diaminopimelate epimerase
MKFTKMHGLGNDYIYFNCFDEEINEPSKISKLISDRHFGVGSDGIVLICPSNKADFLMRMFNADGSESEMCGNAIRCVGKYVYDFGLTDKKNIEIETLAGIKVLELFLNKENKVETVCVDMGEPILKPSQIPVKFYGEKVIGELIDVSNETFDITCVSMGNPHVITYVFNVDKYPVKEIGPNIESHELFPRRTNVEFVEVINEETLNVRVWERGSGETMACGTGACAALVASVLNGKVKRKATVKLLGGDLQIEWKENNNHVYMTGPATTVFHGEIIL